MNCVESNADAVFRTVKKRVDRAIYRGLSAYALTLEKLVVAEIDKMGLNVSGDLRKSVTSKVEQRISQFALTVGVGMKYAIFVHEGTKPHWIPIQPLIEWVHKKQIAGTYSVKTHRRTGGKRKVEQQDKSAAYAIQRSIAKKGTREHPFLRVVFEHEKGKAAAEIAREIAKGLK